MVSRGVGLVAVTAPFMVILVISIECWHLRYNQRVCESSAQLKDVMGSATTTLFAWLATPPQ